MTGVVSRLVRREPLWLVTGAGAVVDALTYALPVVPAGWHVWVNAAVVLAGVVSGRALVSPVTVSAPVQEVTVPAPADPRPAASGNVRPVPPKDMP